MYSRNPKKLSYSKKVTEYRNNSRLLVFDTKGKMKPNEAMSGHRPRFTSKRHTSSTQDSVNVAKMFSEMKEESSKNIENKVSLNNSENRVSSNSMESKNTKANLQSKLWLPSFLKGSTGQVGKDAAIIGHEKKKEYYLQDIDDKLSESIDGEDDSDDDEDNDEDSSPNKETQAPLELMAEFLRAEMCQDYHLAKKLCQMILIYEPENPEAKEFFSLIEELLMEKAQHLEEDEDSEDDSSHESEGESSEDQTEESSDECEDS